jgi:dynein heavy chain
MVEFKGDLKKTLLKCGLKEQAQVFLLTDTQIVTEQFVEAVNGLLSSGDVPNIYDVEDTESIMTACRAACQQEGLQPTKSNIFNTYLTRVKRNLHVVLAFSPVGDTFRTRLRMFPCLVNCCAIDWFHPWPAEALQSVATQQLNIEDLQLPNIEGVVGFAAALEYLKKLDREEAYDYYDSLVRYGLEQFRNLGDYELLASQNAHRAAIFSFSHPKIHAHDLSTYLDSMHGICARAGHHCTMPLLEALGKSATIRFSFSLYNTLDEIRYCAEALRKAEEFFNV